LTAIRTWTAPPPPDNRTLGWDVIGWVSGYVDGEYGDPMVLQPDGPNAGEPFIYTDEQRDIILRLYEITATGKFAHRRAVLRRIKGWGKDPLLATIALAELCGPCRFGEWAPDGTPIAVQHPAPWIDIAAVSQEQTNNTMRLFPAMISPRCEAEYAVDPGKEIIYGRAGTGRIKAVTSSPRSLEGGRPTLVIANETQHWLANNDGLEMFAVIQRNLAKSRDGSARVVEITNAHLPDEGSVAEQTYLAWERSGGKMPGVYYDSLEAPHELTVEDLQDHDKVVAALIDARGDSTWLDVERLAAEIADPTSRPGRSFRFYFNIVRAAGDSFLADGAWDGLEEATIPNGARVVLALDGSRGGERGDSTALTACSIEDVPVLQVVGCWEGDTVDEDGAVVATSEWRVNPLDVEDMIETAARKWKVELIVADPWGWMRSLQVLESRGLPVEEFPQSDARMTTATEKLIDAVNTRLVRHDHDSRLAAHLKNAKTKETYRGTRLKKAFKMDAKKIDLAITAVMAYDKATQLRDGKQEPVGVGVASFADYAAKLTPEVIAEKAKARNETISEIIARAKKAQDEKVAAILVKARAEQSSTPHR